MFGTVVVETHVRRTAEVRYLRRADPSCRGVLLSACVCVCVCVCVIDCNMEEPLIASEYARNM